MWADELWGNLQWDLTERWLVTENPDHSMTADDGGELLSLYSGKAWERPVRTCCALKADHESFHAYSVFSAASGYRVISRFLVSAPVSIPIKLDRNEFNDGSDPQNHVPTNMEYDALIIRNALFNFVHKFRIFWLRLTLLDEKQGKGK